MTDQVGAEICGCAPAAFRQRVSRARRAVSEQIRAALAAAGSARMNRLAFVTLRYRHRAAGVRKDECDG